MRGSPAASGLFLFAAVMLLTEPPGIAHPFALSGFDAWAGDHDVQLDFGLDALSVAAALAPTHGLGVQPDGSLLVEYLSTHFHVANEGRPCALLPPADR